MDPPFNRVKLDIMFNAIRTLTRNVPEKHVMVCYPVNLERNLLGTFSRFMLQPTGIFPLYVSAKSVNVQVYANFPHREFPKYK
jgi:hypothetical protein